MNMKNLTEEELNLKIKEGGQANCELIRRHVVNRISNEENDELLKKLEELLKTLEIKSYSFEQIDYMVNQGVQFKLTGDEPAEFDFGVYDSNEMNYHLHAIFKDSESYHTLQLPMQRRWSLVAI